MIDDLARLLAPLKNRVLNMVARGVVARVDDAKKMQELEIEVLEGESHDEVERFQNYGFTSVPEAGAELAVVFAGGTRDHGLVVAVDDRRYRLKGLEAGEVAVYDKTGSKVVLKSNGDIELTPSSGKVKLTGDLEVTGDVDSSGTVTGSTDVVGGGKSLKTHMHSSGTGTLTVAAAPGPVAGTTGGPT